ncbi:MAG: DUF3450 family protein, partial [Verrucomicrobiota bacterium]
MILQPWRLALLLSVVWIASVRAESPLNETRSTLEKWVETRQLISKTRADWQSDKEMIEQSLLLLQRELKSVDEQMARLGTNSTQVDKERLEAEALLKSSNESLDRARQFATDLAAQINQLAPRLPMPLQDIIKPLMNRLPADPANTKMAATEQMQVIVGVLNELDKFNNAISVFSEKRKNQKGEEVAVETLYVGLGAAYFVNETGDFAGTGIPGANGWEWNTQPSLAPAIREVVQVYRNERPARFVSLPATIR